MSRNTFLGWNVVGLIYDIVGAIFLVVAIFFNSPAKIAHQAGTYWDSSSYAGKALVEQTVDARVGLLILVAGFVFQMFGQWLGDGDFGLLLVLVAAIILLTAAYLARARRWFVDRLVARVEAVQRNLSLADEE